MVESELQFKISIWNTLELLRISSQFLTSLSYPLCVFINRVLQLANACCALRSVSWLSVGFRLSLGPPSWVANRNVRKSFSSHTQTHAHTPRDKKMEQIVEAASLLNFTLQNWNWKRDRNQRRSFSCESESRLEGLLLMLMLMLPLLSLLVLVLPALLVQLQPKIKKRKKKVFCTEVRHARPSSVVAVVAGAVLQIRDQNFVALKCTNKSAASSAADEQRHQQQQQ